ncbi:MAG: Dyp-type peroxidase [SAR324 cluster bacterium]
MAAGAACQAAAIGGKAPFALFLVLQCADPGRAREAARRCAGLPALTRGLGKAGAAARVESAAGFGAAFWDAVSPGARPRDLRALPAIQGTAGAMPATGGDIFLHVKSSRPDVNLELARRFVASLGDTARAEAEVHAFRHLDWRDLTGFIDGTANPSGRARLRAALIGAEDAAFAGGSYVLAQRYVHDLTRWSRLTVAEQEAIVGRGKRDSRELKRAPDSAHIRRAELHVDGVEQPIYRQSLPYGSAAGESGLYFVAYSRNTARLLGMLNRLMGAAPDGLHDRLMEFTRPVSGAFFFVPSLKGLRALG